MTDIKDIESIAYDVLVHFANLAPFGSFNLAEKWLSLLELKTLIKKHQTQCAKYYHFIEKPPCSTQENSESKKLERTILNIQIKIRALILVCQIKPDPNQSLIEQINTMAPLNYKYGKHVHWYNNAQGKYIDFESTIVKICNELRASYHYVDIYQKTSRPLNEIICQQLLIYYLFYHVIKHSKTSNCEGFTWGTIYYLVTQTAYDGNIVQIKGVNVDHTFIVINCDELPKNAFTVDDLPKEVIVIDPWIRCKFTGDKASEYYAHMGAFRLNANQQEPLTFKTGQFLLSTELQQAREFYNGLEKFLSPNLEVANSVNIPSPMECSPQYPHPQ